jgi:hypothetical protein
MFLVLQGAHILDFTILHVNEGKHITVTKVAGTHTVQAAITV